MRDLPTGTVTLLFTDIEGSTRLLHELGERYADVLAEHRRLLRDAFQRHGGVEVDTQGDAFFYAFARASDGVAAADEAQRALSGGPVAVRMGVHTGEPIVTEEGYVGIDVHRAARIMSAGYGGQVLLSQATRDLLDSTVALRDLGEHRLKDIEGTVWIFQVGTEAFPPLKTISNTNLPRPASSFVGRGRELDEVLALLREESVGLLTLTGPGGSGKTRLAIEAATELVGEYPNGVFWVGLAALRDPALVTETIAQTLGAKDGLAAHIGEREMLLLVDNLEQVVEAAPELSRLLESCPNIALLVTSRELLRVRGEVEYEVPPLAEPEAVELFCARARVEPSDEVKELCLRLDSLPLAVELAAARVKVLSPTQILARLAQKLDLLRGGRDADPRHQTLRATIEWSYELLSEEEQQLFRRLSVFAGGCTLGAAEEVADADLDTLQSLVDKSLVRHADERFWMLETIREYGAERLEHTGEGNELRRKHAENFLVFAEECRGRQKDDPEEHEAVLEELQRESENTRSALSWWFEQRRGNEVARLGLALFDFWDIRGYLGEAQLWLERGLEITVGEESTLRAKLLWAASWVAIPQGDHERARILVDENLDLSRRIGEGRALADALMASGAIALALEGRDYARARADFGEAADCYRELEDPLNAAMARNNLGNLALLQGDFAEATQLCRQAESAFREAGDNWSRTQALINLGLASTCQGNQTEAAELFAECLKLGRQLGYSYGVMLCLEGLATANSRRGRARESAVLLGAAERLRRETGTSLDFLELELHEQTALAVRNGLAERFEEVWDEGDAMSFDRAVEYALQSID